MLIFKGKNEFNFSIDYVHNSLKPKIFDTVNDCSGNFLAIAFEKYIKLFFIVLIDILLFLEHGTAKI